MENSKKIRKIFNGLLYIVVLVLIGIIVYQNHQNRQLTCALNSVNESTEKPVSVQDEITQKSAPRNAAPVDRRSGQDDYDNLEYQLEAAEEELAMANEQLAEEIARDDEAPNYMMMRPVDMVQTTEGKEELINALKNGYDQTYSSLFKGMNLSPEEIDQLKEMLAEQQVARIELSKDYPDVPTSEEERKNIYNRLQEQNKQNDAALEALLGSDNFQAFEDYQDRSQDRSVVQRISQELGFYDSLSGDQNMSLLESFYNKRRDAYSQLGFDEESMGKPIRANDENMAKVMSELQLLVYDGYIEGVEEAGLSESQEQQLKEILEAEQTRIKTSLERQARINSGEMDPESDREEAMGKNVIIMN